MGANIKIKSDSSSFQQQMQNVTRQLKVMQSEFGLASEKAKLFGSATDSLKVQQEHLASKLKAQTSLVSLNRDAIKNINKDILEYTNRNKDLAVKIADTDKKHKEAVQTYGKNSKEAKELKTELDKLKESYARNEKGIEASNKKLDDATIKLNNNERALLQTKSALEEVNKKISNLNLDKLEKGFDNVSKASGELSNKLKPVSTAILGVGIVSGKASIDFEDSMAKVMTIADETVMSYDNMKSAILDLSNQTGISANEIANNVYDAISAGQSTADAVNFVTNSTKLAKAGFAEAGQSLDLLTTIMNSYGLEASEVNEVSDTLIQTQNLGKVTVAELSSDMGKLIPTAKSVGVNLEQVSTGYALMTSKGIKSAESTTYMNSMLNELGKSGTTASDTIKELTGKSFQELIASGSTVGDVLAIMSDNATKNGQSLADMFGSSEASKAAMILATDSGNAFNETLIKMSDSAGATDKAFNTVNETTGNKLKQSFNEVKNSAINMGDTLAPIIQVVADVIGNLTEKLSQLDKGQLKAIAGIGGGIVTVNLALGAFSKLTGGIRDGIKAYKDFKDYGSKAVTVVKDFGSKAVTGAKAVGQFALNLGKSALEFGKTAIQTGISTASLVAHKIATLASTVATNAMSIAQKALNLVMSMNPIGLVIAVIVALVGAFIIAYNKCDWFRGMVNYSFEMVKRGVTIAINAVKSVVLNVWDNIASGVSVVLAIPGKIKSKFEEIKSFFSGLKDYVLEKLKSMFNFQIPHIKLPHFSISGEFSLKPPSIPKLGIEWYADGGIMTNPTLFGMNGSNAMIGGEAGAEAILPLKQLWDELDNNFNKLEQRLNKNNRVIQVDSKVILDGKQVGRSVARYVDEENGFRRWN